jgi:hypothetical protein
VLRGSDGGRVSVCLHQAERGTGPGGVSQYASGRRNEGERHQPQRLPRPGLRQPVAELPRDDEPAGHPDDRIAPEPDEGDLAGGDACGDRDDRLGHVVGDAGAVEQPRTLAEAGALRWRQGRVNLIRPGAQGFASSP